MYFFSRSVHLEEFKRFAKILGKNYSQTFLNVRSIK